MLTEADIFPEPIHAFWKITKVIILYVGVNKPVPFPKGCMGQVVRVLHQKSGGAADGAKIFMLLRQVED